MEDAILSVASAIDSVFNKESWVCVATDTASGYSSCLEVWRSPTPDYMNYSTGKPKFVMLAYQSIDGNKTYETAIANDETAATLFAAQKVRDFDEAVSAIKARQVATELDDDSLNMF